jgi:inner membrane protein
MKGASHIVLGVGAALAVNHVAPLGGDLVTFGAALGAAFVGSLLPDIDHDDAKLRHMTGTERGSLGGCLIAPLVGLLGGHRALTHTLVAWFVVSLPAIWLSLAMLLPNAPLLTTLIAWRGAALALSVGYGSHLLADAMTVSGVPLFWPVGEQRVHVLPHGLRFRTGSLSEYAVIAVVAVTIGAMGVWRF